MVMPGETVGAARNIDETSCMDCGAVLKLKVCHSFAGYYLGFECENCGPYSRESDYYTSRAEAELDLSAGTGRWR